MTRTTAKTTAEATAEASKAAATSTGRAATKPAAKRTEQHSANAVADPKLMVMHALRVRGFAEPAAVVETTRIELATVNEVLKTLESHGLADHREGRITGWRLTGDGKDKHAALLAAAMVSNSERSVFEAANTQFEPLNVQLKELCTRWQMNRDTVDEREIIADLDAINNDVNAALRPAAAAEPSFASYQQRLSGAVQRIKCGNWDAFTMPLSGSYHDIWMELHQDLILRLGLKRGENDA